MARFVFSSALELSHNDATFTVTGALSSGIHPDGSPWIEMASGAQITEVTPVSAEISRDHAAGSNSTEPPTTTSPPTTAWTHGLMRDVGKAPSGATLADRQSVNHGLQSAAPKQGFDQLQVKLYDYKYDHSLNIDPGATGSPVSLSPGVYVKAVSKLSGINSQGRPVTDNLAFLTVYAQGNAPASGDFRPGFAQGSVKPGINTSDMILSRLANYDVSAYAGTFPTYSEALNILSAVRLEAHTYSVLAENILAERTGGGGLSAPFYMGTVAAAFGNLMLALNTNRFTSEQKAVLAQRFVQYGIDFAARAREGGVWQDNGGHSHIRKEVVAFAARLTDSTYLSETLSYTTTVAVFGGGSASIWGSDRQIFMIEKADVDRVKMFPYTADQIGRGEWSSDATRDNPSAAGSATPFGAGGEEERQNTLGVAANGTVDNTGGPNNGGLIDRQQYRHIVAAGAAPAALALRMMQAVDLHGNPLWFDYYDRHMDARIANGGILPEATSNDIHPFALYVWETYRASVTETIGVMLLGQSDLVYITSPASFYNQITKPTIRADGNLILHIDTADTTDNITRTVVNPTTAAASNTVNPAMSAMADFLDYVRPGYKFVLGDAAVAGTGRYQLVDNADTDRKWAALEAMKASVETDTPVKAVVEVWYGDDHASILNFGPNFAPLYMGQRWGGEAFTIGSTNPDALNTTAVFDNCFWDITAKPNETGRGLFTRARTKLYHPGAMPRSDAGATEWPNFSNTGGATPRMSEPRRQVMEDFSNEARVKTFHGGYGPSAHIANFNGTTHPLTTTPDGQVLYMWGFALVLARIAGLPVLEPTIHGLEVGSGGAYVDVVVNLPNGGNLTTLRALRSEAAPDPEPPHYQPVIGFEITRGSTRRPVWKTSETDRPAEFRGTVTIQDAGSGSPRRGRVRITPTNAFVTGDDISYLRGQASAILQDPRDPAARVFANVLLEHVPAWHDATATYPCPGIAVKPFQADLEIVVP